MPRMNAIAVSYPKGVWTVEVYTALDEHGARDYSLPMVSVPVRDAEHARAVVMAYNCPTIR